MRRCFMSAGTSPKHASEDIALLYLHQPVDVVSAETLLGLAQTQLLLC